MFEIKRNFNSERVNNLVTKELIEAHAAKYYPTYSVTQCTINQHTIEITLEKTTTSLNCPICSKTQQTPSKVNARSIYCRPLAGFFVKLTVLSPMFRCMHNGKRIYFTFEPDEFFAPNKTVSLYFVDYLTDLYKEKRTIGNCIRHLKSTFSIEFEEPSILNFLKYYPKEIKELNRKRDSSEKAAAQRNKVRKEELRKNGLSEDTDVLHLDKKYIADCILHGDLDKLVIFVEDFGDRILNIINKSFDLRGIIDNAFSNLNRHADATPVSMYVIHDVAARLRNISTVSKSNIMLTSPELLTTMGVTLNASSDGTVPYSTNASRRFIERYRSGCESNPEDKEKNKKQYKYQHDEVYKLFDSFNQIFDSLKTATGKAHYKHHGHKIKIFDGTEVLVSNPKNYELASTTTIGYKNKKKTRHGYKLMSVGLLQENGLLKTAFKFKPINESDYTLARELIAERDVIEKREINLLDRGFVGIELICDVIERNAHFVMPAKSNMSILKRAVLKANEIAKKTAEKKAEEDDEDGSKEDDSKTWTQYDEHSEIMFIENLEYNKDNKDKLFNVAVLRRKKKAESFFKDREELSKEEIEELELNEEKDEYKYVGMITSITSLVDEDGVSHKATAKMIYDLYKLRWNIEVEFKDLKQHWGLEDFYSTQFEHIVYYIGCTLLAFNIGEIFRNIPAGHDLNRQSLTSYIKEKNREIAEAGKAYAFAVKNQNFSIEQMSALLKIIKAMDEISFSNILKLL